MKTAIRTTSTVIATVATAGASTLLFGVAPASAAPTDACGPTGDVVAPGICEAAFTSGVSVFAVTPQMTQLEVLLVGAGGSGVSQEVASTKGYAAGGGGEVKVVDYTGSAGPLTVTVPAPNSLGSVSDGTTNTTVNFGESGDVDDVTAVATGGSSGGGQLGAVGTSGDSTSVAGGGGSSGAASGANGGAGTVVSAIAPVGSLFSGDSRCFGGGGAVDVDGSGGVPGCGGGNSDSSAGPIPSSGGGAGAGTSASSTGASGFVAIRWPAVDITLSFNANGHGIAPADQVLTAGTVPTTPTAPTADGYTFGGWYSDASLTTTFDLTAPLKASTTLYAKWDPALAATGGTIDPAAVWFGFSALFLGAGLVVASRRKRREI